MEALVPGILVEAEIFDISTKGVFVKFLGDVLGTVHFSELGAEHPFDIEETFQKGSKVKKNVSVVKNSNKFTLKNVSMWGNFL